MPSQRPTPDRRRILHGISAVAKRLRRAPTQGEFIARSKISPYFVLHCFRSWSEALRAAGLRPYTRNTKKNASALLEDWGRVVRHVYGREGTSSPATLTKRFGGWSAVPHAFSRFATGKPEWADVVQLLSVPKPADNPPPQQTRPRSTAPHKE